MSTYPQIWVGQFADGNFVASRAYLNRVSACPSVQAGPGSVIIGNYHFGDVA